MYFVVALLDDDLETAHLELHLTANVRFVVAAGGVHLFALEQFFAFRPHLFDFLLHTHTDVQHP
jgi:hypothetical protein